MISEEVSSAEELTFDSVCELKEVFISSFKNTSSRGWSLGTKPNKKDESEPRMYQEHH
jgi:hypothetical protein